MIGNEPNGGGGIQSHWKSMEVKPPDEFQCAQQQQQTQNSQQLSHDQSLENRSGFHKIAEQKSHIIGPDACLSYPTPDIQQTNHKSK